MSRTAATTSRHRLRASLVLILSLFELATIQKPVPTPPETRAETSLRKTAIAPALEIPPVEKPSNQERESAARPVQLIEQSRSWILPDKAWKVIGDSMVKLDFESNGGQTYFGVRFIVPFGER